MDHHELESVQTNEKFLKKLAASKKKVLKQARTLKRFSYGVGGVSVLLAVGSLVSAMSLKFQAKTAAMEAGEHNLQASKSSGFDLHALSWSSMVSSMIWSMVAAKAKQGINAANKPESGSIKSAAKKGIFCIVLVAIAAGMKLCGDNKMVNDFIGDQMQNGLSLAQTHTVQAPEDPYWDMGDAAWGNTEEDGDYADWEPYYPSGEEVDEEIEEDTEEDTEETLPEEIVDEVEDVIDEIKEKWDDWWGPEEDDEEDFEPRRHHGDRKHHGKNKHHGKHGQKEGRKHGKHGKKHGDKHGKRNHKVKAAPHMTLQQKFEANPQGFKTQMKVAGGFTCVILVAVIVSYMSLLNTYKKSVAKHEFLLSIYQNPNAKVVPQHKAKEFVQTKKLEAAHKRTLKAQQKA
jgi:hypothetical protein